MSMTEEHCRAEAAKLRRLAAQCDDQRHRRSLMELAADYEELANRALLRATGGNKPDIPLTRR